MRDHRTKHLRSYAYPPIADQRVNVRLIRKTDTAGTSGAP